MAENKLEDFGEKIGGARKDWAAGRILGMHLKEMTPIEVKKVSTKAYVWPTPDYEQIADDTGSEKLALEIKLFRDMLPAKPVYSRYDTEEHAAVKSEVFVDWIAACRKLGGAKNFTEAHEVCDDLRVIAEKLRDQHRNTGELLGYSALSCLERGEFGVLHMKYEARKILRANPDWPRNNDQASIMARKRGITPYPINDILKGDLKAEWAVSLDRYWHPGQQYNISPDRKGEVIDDIRKHVADKKLFLFKEKKTAWEFCRRVMKSAKRQRDEKRKAKQQALTGEGNAEAVDECVSEGFKPRLKPGQDVTPEMIMEEFGFRGGEFGNWTNQRERQDHLNRCYESLHAMAEILGVEPSFLGLGGTLAIAFGARGKGGVNAACAHYEPGRKVINLTRFNGAGSLAHEWFHAFDHYLAKELNFNREGELASEQLAGRGSEARNIIGSMLESIKHKDVLPDKSEAIEELNKQLASTRRGLEGWMEAATRQMIGGIPFKGVDEQEQAQIDHIRGLISKVQEDYFQAMAEGKADDYRNAFTDRFYLGLAKIRDEHCPARWVRKGRKRSEPLKEAREQIGLWSCTLITRAAKLRGLQSISEGDWEKDAQPEKVETDVYKASKDADKLRSGKAYYTQPCELLARGFEAYVANELANGNRRDDYLVSGAKMGGVYAKGAEAEAVSEAFTKGLRGLVKELYHAAHKEDYQIRTREGPVGIEWDEEARVLCVSSPSDKSGSCHLGAVNGTLLTLGPVRVHVHEVNGSVVGNDDSSVAVAGSVSGYVQGNNGATIRVSEGVKGEVHVNDDSSVWINGEAVATEEGVAV